MSLPPTLSVMYCAWNPPQCGGDQRQRHLVHQHVPARRAHHADVVEERVRHAIEYASLVEPERVPLRRRLRLEPAARLSPIAM